MWRRRLHASAFPPPRPHARQQRGEGRLLLVLLIKRVALGNARLALLILEPLSKNEAFRRRFLIPVPVSFCNKRQTTKFAAVTLRDSQTPRGVFT